MLSRDKRLEKLIQLIKQEGTFSEIFENEVIDLFDDRGEKAVKVLRDKKLHKLFLNDKIAIWEVEGKSSNYLIIDNSFCECTDFQIRVLSRGEKTICYHLLAKIIGEEFQIYNMKKISNEDYDKLLMSRIKK